MLQESIDRWCERIRQMEYKMQGFDWTDTDEKKLQPIAEDFRELIRDVMGINLNVRSRKTWNFDYNLNYDKVLDYALNLRSNLTYLEISGLFVLEIPLDIINVWIQFVRTLCDLPSILTPEKAQKVNEQLHVIERTVVIMREIVLAAKTISSGRTSKDRDTLSIYAYNIIPGIRDIIDPFVSTHKLLFEEYSSAYLFWVKMNVWDSFSDIYFFIRDTFIDDAAERFGIETK